MVTSITRNQLTQSQAVKAVRRPGVALELGTATFNIFTIAGGLVEVVYMFGHCTQLIAGTALPRIQFTPTGGALTPLCAAAADIDTDAVNSMYGWSGYVAGTLTVSATIGGIGLVAATSRWGGHVIELVPGVISITDATGAAVTGGLIDWYILYVPMTTTAVITAA